MAHKLQSGGN